MPRLAVRPTTLAMPFPPAARRRLTPLLALLAAAAILVFVLAHVHRLPLLSHVAVGWPSELAGWIQDDGLAAAVSGEPSAQVLQGRKRWDDQGDQVWNLRDRLLPDERYLVTGHIAGWTNQVMAAVHTIHLALLTARTPLLPYFHGYASQLGDTLVTSPVRNLAFGQVFDVPRLWAGLKSAHGEALRGVVDVEEVMDIHREAQAGGRGWPSLGGMPNGGSELGAEGVVDQEREVWELGCWAARHEGLGYPLERLRIHPHFTRLPQDALYAPMRPTWAGLVRYLDAHDVRQTENIVQEALLGLNVSGRPGDWMACVDTIYYATEDASQSLWSSWSTPPLPLPPPSPPTGPLDALPPDVTASSPLSPGPWETVGQFVHWTPELEALGRWAARRVFAVDEGEAVPDFVAVHVRHGDFLRRCQPSQPCFSLASFAHALSALQTRLAAERDLPAPLPVLLTTDETDPAFFEGARARGWVWVGEGLSAEVRREWGDWYPMLLDNVLLSMGKGFVGTADSTMSLLNGRRVEYWNDGLAVYVNQRSPEE